MDKVGKVAAVIIVALIIMYLAYRAWYIHENCFGSINGTEICK